MYHRSLGRVGLLPRRPAAVVAAAIRAPSTVESGAATPEGRPSRVPGAGAAPGLVTAADIGLALLDLPDSAVVSAVADVAAPGIVKPRAASAKGPTSRVANRRHDAYRMRIC